MAFTNRIKLIRGAMMVPTGVCYTRRATPKLHAAVSPATDPFKENVLMTEPDLIIDVGAIVDGVASAGSTLALSVARRGVGVHAYNSYRSWQS